MTKTEFRKLLDTMAEAWIAGDARKAADCFAEGVRYGDPTRYGFTSREDLYKFYAAETNPERSEWHHVLFDEEAQLGAAEYSYQGTKRYHGLVLIKVTDGQITHWREYQHVSLLDWKEFVGATLF